MSAENQNSVPLEETDADRRRGILDGHRLSLDLVSALAGDRPLTANKQMRLAGLRESQGERFYSGLLYSLTHQYYAPEVAEALWTKVLAHKEALAGILGRNVRIAVAALDFLSNITGNMGAATLVDEAQIEEIVSLSLRDGLTGLFNHTYFYQQIDFEVRRYLRYGAPLSLMLIDIDGFKEVNDLYGHRQGDRVLAALGRILRREARDSDISCRYGGDEFAVILPCTGFQEAGAIAARLGCELSEKLPCGRIVTVSIGLASCAKETGSYRQLVEAADAALYQAKNNGKNQVVSAQCPG